MIYQHKYSKAYVHLISSGNGYCVIAAMLKKLDNNFLNAKKSVYDEFSAPGKVFRGGKKEFKKFFKKSSAEQAIKDGYEIVPNEMLTYVKNHCEENIYNILNNTDQFITNSIIRDNKLKKIKEKQDLEQKNIMQGYEVVEEDIGVDNIGKVLQTNK